MSLREQVIFIFGTLTAIFAVFFNVALAFLVLELRDGKATTESLNSVGLAAVTLPLLVAWSGLFAGAYSTVLRWIINAILISEPKFSDFVNMAFFSRFSYLSFWIYVACLGVGAYVLWDLRTKLAGFPSDFVLWLTVGVLLIWQLTVVIIAIHLALSKTDP